MSPSELEARVVVDTLRRLLECLADLEVTRHGGSE